MDIEITKGRVSPAQVQLLVAVPPRLSISKAMGQIKGKTLRKLVSGDRRLSKALWGRHLRGRGRFAASSGNVPDEVIMLYLSTQNLEECPREGDFTLSL